MLNLVSVMHSNTTFVKVKCEPYKETQIKSGNSNTTFVKVKLIQRLNSLAFGNLFKYNIC